MNKKAYTKPSLKLVNIRFSCHLMSGSTKTGVLTTANMSLSRENNSFDDDDEAEIEDSMWK